jgi:hypothetical protein
LKFPLSSASTRGGTCPPERSGVRGARRAVEPKMPLRTMAPRAHQLRWQTAMGPPSPRTVPETNTTTSVGATTSSTTSEVAASGPTASTGPTVGAPSYQPQMSAATASVGDDGNTVKELEVIVRHLGLRAPGDVSHSVIPRSEKEGTKPPYVCPECSNHTYSNNMITRFHVQ